MYQWQTGNNSQQKLYTQSDPKIHIQAHQATMLQERRQKHSTFTTTGKWKPVISGTNTNTQIYNLRPQMARRISTYSIRSLPGLNLKEEQPIWDRSVSFNTNANAIILKKQLSTRQHKWFWYLQRKKELQKSNSKSKIITCI